MAFKLRVDAVGIKLQADAVGVVNFELPMNGPRLSPTAAATTFQGLVEGRKVGGDEIAVRVNGDVAEASGGGDGKLIGIVRDARRKKFPRHEFEDGDEGIPIGDHWAEDFETEMAHVAEVRTKEQPMR